MKFEENIELRVLLLAIYKKQEDESLKDILKMMDNSRVFDLKKGKNYLKEHKKLGFLSENELTVLGIVEAKKVEIEFKI